VFRYRNPTILTVLGLRGPLEGWGRS
jgi:hypothetical protein